MNPLDELIKIRKQKLNQLKKAGINPYPSKFRKSHTLRSVKENYTELEGHDVRVAGRILSLREHGKAIFATIRDWSGELQIYFKYDTLGKDKYSLLKNFDIADFIGCEGLVFTTRTGEVTVSVTSYEMLSKALRPLPEKLAGLTDPEKRFRQRYLDLIMNPEVKKRLLTRQKIVAAIRDFLTDRDFIEVSTPILQPLYGGGLARPFSTHHNALDIDLYLRIANELYLKRLIVGGFEKIFEFSIDFRNEGIDHTHNPEFTLLETMWAYVDYRENMELLEELFPYVANRVLGTTLFTYQGTEINLSNWVRIPMVEAVETYTGTDFSNITKKAAQLAAKTLGVPDILATDEVGTVVGKVFEEKVEEKLIQPTIVYDYPTPTSPLAKRVTGSPEYVERFEVFICSAEYANVYSELNDPLDLRERFNIEATKLSVGDKEAHQTDEDFIIAVEHGLPPVSGVGIGIDRLAMLFADTDNIREVITFPTMKPLEPKRKPSPNLRILPPKKLFSISDDLKSKFPNMNIGCAIIKGIKVKKQNKVLDKLKKEILKDFKNLKLKDIKEIPQIKSYRTLFKAFGVDWHHRRPAPEALLRRIVSKKAVGTINNAVDATNLSILKTKVSAGIFDYDKINFPTQLKLSTDREKITLIGEDKPTMIKKGELIYADKKGPFNLDFNYRDADRTKITKDTKNLMLNVDGCDGISREEVEKALDLVCDFITRFAGGEVEQKFIVSS